MAEAVETAAVLGAGVMGSAIAAHLAGAGIRTHLLDIVLPGIDGFTFLQELKQENRWKNIPVIILSNLGQYDEVKKGLQLGAVDYMVKANAAPIEIVKKVETFLKSHTIH